MKGRMMSRCTASHARDFAVLCLACTALTCQLSAAVGDDGVQDGRHELSLVAHGSPSEAASALVGLVPGFAGLQRHYEELVGLAGSCQGTIDLLSLKHACRGFHAWHAVETLDSSERRIAILQWMSEKIWESPTSPDKQRIVDRFVDDVGQLIDQGRIPPIPALTLAMRSVFIPAVLPDLSTKKIVTLLKRMLDASTGDVKQCAWGLLFEFGGYLDSGSSEKKQLRDYLTKAYPEKSFADDPEAFFRPPGLARPRAITREDYDSINEVPLDALQERLIQEQCCSARDSTLYCSLAVRRLLTEYTKAPEDVRARLVSLVERGLNLHEIMSFADPKPLVKNAQVDSTSPFVALPVFEAVFAACEKRLDGPPLTDFETLAVDLKSFLFRLAEEHAVANDDLAETLERRCTDLLLKACQADVRWRASGQRSEYGYLASFEALKSSMPNLSSASKERIRASLDSLLKSRDYDGLSGKNRERIQKVCGEIIASK